MPHVLRMAAPKLGNPVPIGIAVIARNGLLHDSEVSLMLVLLRPCAED
jgi:hypothetical protein